MVRPRPCAALLLSALVLLTHLVQGFHQAADVHVYCAVHDRVEHMGHEPHDDGHDDRGSHGEEGEHPDPRPEEDDHEWCPFPPPAPGEDRARDAIVLVAPLEGIPPSTPPVQPLYAETLHLLAPKHSPPARI